MERNQANLLQGTLDLLILKAIGDGEFHGLGIARFRSHTSMFGKVFVRW